MTNITMAKVASSMSACCGALPDIWEGVASNTLRYNPALCINCAMCLLVCPHGVFAAGAAVVQLAYPEACIECGACQLNCPVGAIRVDNGVGCAAALIQSALSGQDETPCSCDSGRSGCC
jgi:NAD-dependent dihydropyrimidine dehydrogenase PreA subunit